MLESARALTGTTPRINRAAITTMRKNKLSIQLRRPRRCRLLNVVTISSLASQLGSSSLSYSLPQSMAWSGADDSLNAGDPLESLTSCRTMEKNQGKNTLCSDILAPEVESRSLVKSGIGSSTAKRNRKANTPMSAASSVRSDGILIPGMDAASVVSAEDSLPAVKAVSAPPAAIRSVESSLSPASSQRSPKPPAPTEAEEYANLRKGRYERCVSAEMDHNINQQAQAGVAAGLDTTMPAGYVPPSLQQNAPGAAGYPAPTFPSPGPFQFYPYPYAVSRPAQRQFQDPAQQHYYPVQLHQPNDGGGRRSYLAWLIAALTISGVGAATGIGLWIYRKKRRRVKQRVVVNPYPPPLQPNAPEFGMVGYVPMVDGHSY